MAEPTDLGPIGVTFATYRTPGELIGALQLEAQRVHYGPDEQNVIVLISPDWLRERLLWPVDRTPVPAVYSHDLVFMPPRALERSK